MDIRIEPRALCGKIGAIASKSHVHRALICSALSDGPTTLHMNGGSADIDATVGCLAALGAAIERGNGTLHVTPPERFPEHASLDCMESGSTLRFLLPVAAALCESADFTGSGKLPERPLTRLLDELAAHGATFSSPRLPFRVTRMTGGGEFRLPGNISSQYVTGLLLAGPAFGGIDVNITSNLESAGYVDMTIGVMHDFGVAVRRTASGFSVEKQIYRSPVEIYAQGDWSNAAFWLVSGSLSGGITCTGLDASSCQGDRLIVDIMQSMGAAIKLTDNAVEARPSALCGTCIDASQIPDLVPALAVAASVARGETRMENAARLRYKESDRLKSVADMINNLGGRATETEEGLVIAGVPRLRGGAVYSANDHRIAMAAGIAACVCDGPVTIRGAEAVNKSYPAFWNDYRALGGFWSKV